MSLKSDRRILTGRHVHRFASQREQKPQYLHAIILMFLGRYHCRIASNSTLPYRIRYFSICSRKPWNAKALIEKKVRKRIDQLLRQRFGIFAVVDSGPSLCFIGPRLGSIEQYFSGDLGLASLLLARRPEELFLPCL